MKKTVFKITSLILVLALLLSFTVSCSGTCEHKDEDGDGVCDLCGENVGEPSCSHRDIDEDGVCDKCGKNLGKLPCSHEDEDRDGVCDKCGENIGEPAPSKDELLEEAEAALAEKPYKIVTSFTAECDNPKYSKDISALFGGSSVEITVGGGNIKVETPGSMSIYYSVIIVNNTAYVRYINYDSFESFKVKSPMTDEERTELWNLLPTKSRLSVFDFTEAEVSEDGSRILCKSLSPSVYDEIAAELDISDSSDKITNVSFSDAEMTVNLSDGKYDSLVIDYTLRCDIDGEAVTVNISAVMDYTYEQVDYIIIPEDASKYKAVDFPSLITLFQSSEDSE